MLEIPESKTISRQAGNILKGRKITEVVSAASLHEFDFPFRVLVEYTNLFRLENGTCFQGFTGCQNL